MKIDFDENIRPYFQVMVAKVTKPVTAGDFFKKLRELVASKKAKASKHLVELLQPTRQEELTEDEFLAILLRHSSVPTWYKQEDHISILGNKRDLPLDVEHDLLIFYKKDDYVFVYTNCSYIFGLVTELYDQFFEDDGIRFVRLKADQLNQILSQFKMEYRSLGIRNYFPTGGQAPEGKTYYSRDASQSLTPSFDAGYGFNYCIGAIIGKGSTTPFGCSKNKSKIWTSWVEDLNELCVQCDLIVKWLNNPKKDNDQLDVLVQAAPKKLLEAAKPLEFFLDYFVLDKGLVYLGNDDRDSLSWSVNFDTDRDLILVEVVLDDDEVKTTMIISSYDKENENYQFLYLPTEEPFLISIREAGESATGRNTLDLVDFLNQQHHFTILHDLPYAYRDEECWQDNRLKRLFANTSKEIDWATVDITKENKAAAKGKKNILQKINEYCGTIPDLILACNDNGSNEIADYLIVCEGRLILIHAKYASKNTPGLLIEDIQVVASQTIKNIRFFGRNFYSDKTIARLFGNATYLGTCKKHADFRAALLSALSSKDIKKECWIVQPGISIGALKKDPTNKMHTILNFVDSLLTVNGISFKLVGSA